MKTTKKVILGALLIVATAAMAQEKPKSAETKGVKQPSTQTLQSANPAPDASKKKSATASSQSQTTVSPGAATATKPEKKEPSAKTVTTAK